MARFGAVSLENICEEIQKSAPVNTIKSKKSVWSQFQNFCADRNYDVSSGALSAEKLNDILMDWGFNMRKADGTYYKELVVKQMWNSVAKQIQEMYYNKFNVKLDPFGDVAFKGSRNARDSHRKQLQLNPEFRKPSSSALTASEVHQIIDLYDENTPDGLQRKFYHIAAHELAWRGGEATHCLVRYFREEFDNKGISSGRIEYNPVISKTAQGGSKKLTDSKWLILNQLNESASPVRLLRKLLSKPGRNINIDRLFLTPNPDWKSNDINTPWFKNSPVGKNTISKWTRIAAEAIGIDTQKIKITNHSHRSTTISQLAKAGVPEQSLIKMTGHSSSSSIKPYLQFDGEHHSKIMQQIRTDVANHRNAGAGDVTNHLSSDSNAIIEGYQPNIYNNCNFHFNNCSNLHL